MFQDGSAPVFRANASAMQHPTLSRVRIGSTRDALQIFYAVAQGKLPMTHRRLDAEERRAIVTGNVYIWEERGANSEATGLGIERWTDGMRWSPSRVRDDFLFYHQKEMDPEEAAGLPPTRWARTVRPRTSTSDGSPVDSPTESANTAQRPLNDPMRLIKQTYSVIVNLPQDRPRQITRKWHLTAYFTQATVNELQKVDEVLPTVPVVPDGWFRSARSGKQRQGAKTQRPIQFANSFGPDTPGMSPTMDLQDTQVEDFAGPSGSSPRMQSGHDAQPFQQQDFALQIPQYSPYRLQDAYEMPSSRPPQPGPLPRGPVHTALYNGRPFGSQPLAHLSLPPPPSMPSYKTPLQLGSVAASHDKVRGPERKPDEAGRREGGIQQQQHRQYEQQHSAQVHGESSITVVAPMTYDRTPARPLPSVATLNLSPTPGHPYANAIPSRIQKIPSGPGTPGRPSEYYEPPSALKTIPVKVSPSFTTGHRSEGEFSSNVAGGGVYRTPHSHARAHSRHRSSPNHIAPHHLPLPPSPPAPMSHLGAGEQLTEPPTSDTASVPGSNFASVSPAVSTSASALPTVTAAPSAIRLVDLAQFSVSANVGIAGQKERVLVPLGELQMAVYRRRDPMDDALLRRFSGLRTTPPANMMEE